MAVYLLESRTFPGLFKIGFTRHDAETRAAWIMAAAPVLDLRVVFEVAGGDRALGVELQERFQSHRVMSTSREWFRFDPDVYREVFFTFVWLEGYGPVQLVELQARRRVEEDRQLAEYLVSEEAQNARREAAERQRRLEERWRNDPELRARMDGLVEENREKRRVAHRVARAERSR